MTDGLPLKLALAPLLLPQALWTRWRTPRLPEATGPREGSVGGDGLHGSAPAFRLLIVGDSSAAGVGVSDQRDALSGCLADALAQRLQARVDWQLCARSGANSAQLIELLPAQAATDIDTDTGSLDAAVVVSGVNDVVDRVPPVRALQHRAALLQRLLHDFKARHVVMTPVPPMQHFRALPQPLRWLAGRDAAAHDAALARWVSAQPRTSHLSFELPLADADLLAADGFHPGAALYALWGRALAEHLVARSNDTASIDAASGREGTRNALG